MDLSKLPKMGNTPPPPAPAQPAEPVRTGPERYVEPPRLDSMLLGSVWISIILGLLFMFLGMNFAKWGVATIRGQEFPTGWLWDEGPKVGQPREYWDLKGHTALADMGLFLLGISLILEAGVLVWVIRQWRGWRLALMAAIALAVLATVVNGYATLRIMIFGILPIASLVGLGLSGFGVFYLVGLRTTGRNAPIA